MSQRRKVTFTCPKATPIGNVRAPDRKCQSQRFELGYLVLGSVRTQVAALVEARSMTAPCPWGLVSTDKETAG